MKKVLIENTIKNLILIVLLFALYSPIVELFKGINYKHYDSLLTTTTLLIMAALFADYAFTYAHTRIKNSIDRYFSHAISFIIMLCTGLMLESVIIIVNLKVSTGVWVITFVSIAFYISLVMYDYWDMLRSKSN